MTASKRRKANLFVAGAVVLALGRPASAADKMKLTLNWLAQPFHVGFVIARDKGYYADEGIDLTIEEGKGSGTTALMAATGQTDVAYANAGSAMAIMAKGAPLKIIAPIIQGNIYSIVSLTSSEIGKPTDLVGKKIGVCPGCAQIPMLDAMIKLNGVDESKVQIINVDSSAFISLLANKKLDAVAADPGTVSIPMRGEGLHVSDMFFQEFGIDQIGLSLFANESRLKANPSLYKRFLKATLKGWAEAAANPKEAVAILQKDYPENNPDSNNPMAWMKTLVVPMMCLPGAPGIGEAPAKAWDNTVAYMVKYMGFSSDHSISFYYTTAYLPTELPPCP